MVDQNHPPVPMFQWYTTVYLAVPNKQIALTLTRFPSMDINIMKLIMHSQYISKKVSTQLMKSWQSLLISILLVMTIQIKLRLLASIFMPNNHSRSKTITEIQTWSTWMVKLLLDSWIHQLLALFHFQLDISKRVNNTQEWLRLQSLHQSLFQLSLQQKHRRASTAPS